MQPLRTAISERLSGSEESPCECTTTFDGDWLEVDADACEGGGRLETSPDCRRSVIAALETRDVDSVRVSSGGVDRIYENAAAALLVSAGRFAERVRAHDERLADRARRDPIGAAHEATGRPGTVADIAASTGLAELAARAPDIESALSPVVGLSVSHWRVETATPGDATLTARRSLDTGATVRCYERPEDRDRYVLAPLEHDLDRKATAHLAEAFGRLASGQITGEERAPARAVREVVPDDDTTEEVATVLHKHTRGYGLLEDLFADPEVSDVFLSAPATDNPVRVQVDGRVVPTNVRIDRAGIRALASRFRHESGRGFSSAQPTLDTSVRIGDRRVRIAGVTSPVSDGTAFAFRAHDRFAWTLPALLDNGTLTPEVAALLSIAIERGRSLLMAGPRGSGKTTLLSALLWEIPPAVRTVLIEDAPELPVGALQTQGRDVQALRADDETTLSPEEALRTALRLGNGALVVGEVRGQEASALYEAMRVGAKSETVLGTIHGKGAAGVYERVVSDLGVDPVAFGATDIVVTLEIAEQASQSRRVGTVEEVVDAESESFETLFDRPNGDLVSTGHIDRANSAVVERLARPTETYAQVRHILQRRKHWFEKITSEGTTDPASLTEARLGRD